jgi:hypothetical protein
MLVKFQGFLSITYSNIRSLFTQYRKIEFRYFSFATEKRFLLFCITNEWQSLETTKFYKISGYLQSSSSVAIIIIVARDGRVIFAPSNNPLLKTM